MVAADGSGLEFLADGCADGVIAEDGTLSRHLAAETLVAEIARVLRPGGQVLACVDSLTFGMAVLAEQHRWPHLIDVPNADVVLVPWPDGTITRCYGAEQLRELFTERRARGRLDKAAYRVLAADGQLPAGPRPGEFRRAG